MQKEKNQRSFNFFLDKSIELITDFTSSIPIDGVLAHKDIINSASSQIKNDSSYLNINKKHLPISPKTYLKKWESEVKKKTNHHRRISEFLFILHMYFILLK